ncbi:uncharacterized protein AB675_9619 [Cyphellophora attinorum]|uniref:Isochorismatase-like domain-containing protein n=1 Tax=Cyphellophora attinorum TaxID=1664694 RepID=A0A0N1HD40_9EURO|nr:uncharacterized protein AB675_9619 [Phialophora attinorum]KPI42453.1 hypothetical protein AB675_9619 [Phialophora attinorum]
MARKARQRQNATKGAEGDATEAPAATGIPLNSFAKHRYPSTAFQYITNISVQRALQLVIVTAIYSTVSQSNLAPVYGSIPSSLYHRYGCIASIFLAFGIRRRLPTWVNKCVPTWAFWIPTVQFAITSYSDALGPVFGPVLTELITYYPLLVLAFYVSIDLFYSTQDPDTVSGLSEATPACVLFAIFSFIQRSSRDWLAHWVGTYAVFSRIGLQLAAGLLYCMILPRSLFWPAFPSVIYTFLGNSHTPLISTTELLNNTLALHDYTLLERAESVSGYISVLDSNKDGFRVMRCDHSLLGGEWLNPPAPSSNDPPRLVGEPIYAVFTMLEAVRLVEPAPVLAAPRNESRALNIGLGVGTAPSALMAHGIRTTVLELDPAVHHFAVKYFSMPTNHYFAHGDAVGWVESRKNHRAGEFDYIIHDVFTGGAEPVPLFTQEFLSGLHMLLRSDGVIAINYAGDLKTPSASLIYRTITSVFGDGCRVFREEPAPNKEVNNEGDFTNMVFFCRKHPDGLAVKFRKPVTADFLGSSLRKSYMMPQHEILPEAFDRAGGILTRKNTKILEKPDRLPLSTRYPQNLPHQHLPHPDPLPQRNHPSPLQYLKPQHPTSSTTSPLIIHHTFPAGINSNAFISPYNKLARWFTQLEASGAFPATTRDPNFPQYAVCKTLQPADGWGSKDEILYLRARGVRHVVLCGLTTVGPVLGSARLAADMDFHVVVVREGVMDDEEVVVGEFLLERVLARFADVVGMADLEEVFVRQAAS